MNQEVSPEKRDPAQPNIKQLSGEECIYTELRHHWCSSHVKERSERLSWATDEMSQIAELTAKLINKHGWADACYCPKDGSVFLAWSPCAPMPYRCRYEGAWPDGTWWALVDGDVWPDRPVLWKPLPAATGGGEAGR